MRQRESAAWSGDDALGFVRDGGAWVQFQAPAGDEDLLKPTNLVATPSDLEASFTWSNPTPLPIVTPTHVQVRIPATTSVWTELEYPATSWDIAFLTAATGYQFQARYVYRGTTGSIELTGNIAEIFFTTTALVGPGTPAADPSGSGPDAIVPWGPPPGGTAGAVGSSDCWWEYVIQQFDADLYTWSDSATTAEIAGDIGDYEIDFVAAGFACDEVLRWKYREVCDSVPGDWDYSLAFTVVCDYADPCGGMGTNAFFASAPWTDVDIVFAGFQSCYNEIGQLTIEDTVDTTAEYGKLSGFHMPLFLAGAWEMRAKDSLSVYGEGLVAGRIPGLVPLGSSVPSLTSDFSFSMDIRAENQPGAGSGAPVKVAEIGKTVKVYMYAEGSGIRFSVAFDKEGGGSFDLASTTELAIDDWHTVTVTIDQDGSKILYLDGLADVTDATVTRADFSGVTGEVEYYANDRMRIRHAGGWGRVLTPSEVGSLKRSRWVQHMIVLGAEALWAFDGLVAETDDSDYDSKVAALTSISVHYPFDVELT